MVIFKSVEEALYWYIHKPDIAAGVEEANVVVEVGAESAVRVLSAENTLNIEAFGVLEVE